jgi:hypothetical protein
MIITKQVYWGGEWASSAYESSVHKQIQCFGLRKRSKDGGLIKYCTVGVQAHPVCSSPQISSLCVCVYFVAYTLHDLHSYCPRIKSEILNGISEVSTSNHMVYKCNNAYVVYRRPYKEKQLLCWARYVLLLENSRVIIKHFNKPHHEAA